MTTEQMDWLDEQHKRRGLRVRPVLAWYDAWVGCYWDRRERRLFVLPLPCVGIVVEFPQ